MSSSIETIDKLINFLPGLFKVNPRNPNIYMLVLDGVDSTGKSTLAKAMNHLIETKPNLFDDFEFRFVKFPRPTASQEGRGLSAIDFLYDFARFFDEHTSIEHAKPIIYITDRYWMSTLIYNGDYGLFKRFIESGKHFPVITWSWTSCSYQSYQTLNQSKPKSDRDDGTKEEFYELHHRFEHLLYRLSYVFNDQREPMLFTKLNININTDPYSWEMEVDKVTGATKAYPNVEALAKQLLTQACSAVREMYMEYQEEQSL